MNLDFLGGEGAEKPSLLSGADELYQAAANGAEVVVEGTSPQDRNAHFGHNDLELFADADYFAHRPFVEIIFFAEFRLVGCRNKGVKDAQ